MNRLRPLIAPPVIFVVTAILIVPMILVAVIKLLLPLEAVRRPCRRIVTRIAETWVSIVVWSFRISYDTRIEVTGDLEFDRNKSYILIANHLSWIDVPVLLRMFGLRLPFYRFFLKRSLIWLPFLGIAFWALEYPFIRFRSRRYLERHPEKRGEGLETARRACEHIRGVPSTIVTFPEGAIFTRQLHQRQRSRYRHLLRPHAGGPSLVISAMADQLDSLIDVTLHYPDGTPGVPDFLCNRVRAVRVHVRRIEIPESMTRGDYQEDPEFRERFRDWLNGIWKQKDQLLEQLTTRREDRAFCDETHAAQTSVRRDQDTAGPVK